jgi:membrane protease YdiL (CAAX protease family)
MVVALAIGVIHWLGADAWLEMTSKSVDAGRLSPLFCVIAQQVGFLATAFRFKCLKSERITPATAFLAGLLFMLLAVLLGLLYDCALRLLFNSAAPTLGPWGEVHRLDFWPATAIVTWGVVIGPAGDEFFFRAGLFETWQSAGRPWSGALLSSGLFALARLDSWNLPAYFGLGMLLCGAYRWTGSLLAVWIGHALLNAAMFVFLFCGYE